MDGVYDILNFLTGDNLFTHQLPRAMRECEPWLRTQFPDLFPESPKMAAHIEAMDKLVAEDGAAGRGGRELRQAGISKWLHVVQKDFGLPDMLPVYEMASEMHTRIDPIKEAQSMVGDDRVIVVRPSE
jgi:hypothetical protein